MLQGATELVEIRDPSGAVIGFFAPVQMERAARYAQAAAATDPLEIRRRKEAGNQAQTTQEVLNQLHSLPSL